MYEKRNRHERQGQIHMISIEDLVPKNHILREIDAAIDFSFIYDEVKGMYNDFNRRICPSKRYFLFVIRFLDRKHTCNIARFCHINAHLPFLLTCKNNIKKRLDFSKRFKRF